MTKAQGSRNYNQDEQQHLLSILGDTLPRCKADWEAVSARYNRSRDLQWAERSAASLKRKFVGLSSTTSCENSVIKSKALELKRKILKHATTTRHQEVHVHYRNDALPDESRVAQRTGGHDVEECVEDVPPVADRPSTSLQLSDNQLPAQPALCEVTSGATPQHGDASSPRRVLPNHKHIHCDVIQLFLWFQRRDEQQLTRWKDLERQHKQDICAANRRHRELLEYIAALKTTSTS